MATAAFIFIIVFFSIFFEVLAGSIGIIIPLTAISVFYISVTFGWRKGVVISLIAGSVVDLLYGRTVLLSPLLMVLTVMAGLLWLHKGDPVSILPNLIPGTLTAFIVTFPFLALSAYFYGNYLHNFYLLTFSMVSGSLLLPLIIAFLDSMAERQKLPLYRKAKAAVMNKR